MDAIELPLNQIIPETMWAFFKYVSFTMQGSGILLQSGEGLIFVEVSCKTW